MLAGQKEAAGDFVRVKTCVNQLIGHPTFGENCGTWKDSSRQVCNIRNVDNVGFPNRVTINELLNLLWAVGLPVSGVYEHNLNQVYFFSLLRSLHQSTFQQGSSFLRENNSSNNKNNPQLNVLQLVWWFPYLLMKDFDLDVQFHIHILVIYYWYSVQINRLNRLNIVKFSTLSTLFHMGGWGDIAQLIGYQLYICTLK